MYGVGVVWFIAAAIYTYQAAIKDFIELAREGKKERMKAADQ